jgi:hypothetical protein
MFARGLGVLLAGLAGVAAASAAAASAVSSAASGNAAAIVLFKQAQSALAGYQGISFTGSPAAYKILREQGYDSFQVATGIPNTPGYSRAVDDALVVLHDGVTTEQVDTFKASGQPGIRQWQGAKEEAVAEVLDSSPCGLSYTALDHYVIVGEPFFGSSFSGDRSSAPSKSGGNETVSFSFAAAGGTADETLTIGASNHLLQRLTLQIHGGPSNGITERETDYKYSRTQPFEDPPATLGKCP